MILVADFTGELRLELQLPRSAAKTDGNSLVSGTDLITQAAHLVAVTSLPKYASSGVAWSRTSCATTLVVEREIAGQRLARLSAVRIGHAGLLLPAASDCAWSRSIAKDQREGLDEESTTGFNHSAGLSTYPGKSSVRTTRATAVNLSLVTNTDVEDKRSIFRTLAGFWGLMFQGSSASICSTVCAAGSSPRCLLLTPRARFVSSTRIPTTRFVGAPMRCGRQRSPWPRSNEHGASKSTPGADAMTDETIYTPPKVWTWNKENGGRSVRFGLRGRKSELQDSGSDGPQRADPHPRLRVRRDTDPFG
jgi:hypothetical protein